MTTATDEPAPRLELWTALGADEPLTRSECNVAECVRAQPWDIFCPEHEHLLILGPARPTDRRRWKPRWLLGHASRIALVAIFPLAARWRWELPLFLLAIAVDVALVVMVSRNYPATRRSMRIGFGISVASWILLRLAFTHSDGNQLIRALLHWLPLGLIVVAAACLWHSALAFFRRRLELDAAATTIGFGLLTTLTLFGAAVVARRNRLLDDPLPSFLPLVLLYSSVAAGIIALVIAFVQNWWVSRATVSTDVAPFRRRSSAPVTTSIVLQPDPTPVQPPRPPRRSFVRRVRLEVRRVARGVLALRHVTVSVLLKAASTVRTQVIIAGRFCRSASALTRHSFIAGVTGAGRCLAWMLFRIGVPILAAMVATAAAWRFATILIEEFYGKGIWASLWAAMWAAGYVIIGVAAIFIAWTLITGCDRIDMLTSAWGAIRTITPRLLLIFTAGAVVVEVLSLIWRLSPIRPGPLTIAALVLVGLSFATEQDPDMQGPDSAAGVE